MTNKNFTITSVIFNEIVDVTEDIFGEGLEENYELARQLAENELGLDQDEINKMDETEYQTLIDEEMNSIICIKRIDENSILFNALLKYFHKDQKSNINGYKHAFYDNVRSCVFDGDYMYYVTGCGYDTVSSDLLGKSADGTEKYNFIEWLNK